MMTLFVSVLIGLCIVLAIGIAWLAVDRGRLQQAASGVIPKAHSVLIQGMNEGMLVLDARGRVVEANPHAAIMVGRSFDAVLGQPFDAVVPGRGDLVELVAEFNEVVDEIEMAPRGERRIYEVRLVPVEVGPEDVPGSLVIMRDITEDKEQQQERLYRIRETVVLNRVLASVTSSLDPETALSIVCEEVALSMGLPQASIAVLGDDGATLRVVAEYVGEGRISTLGHTMSVVNNPIIEHAFSNGHTVTVENVEAEPLAEQVRDRLAVRGVAAVIDAPLIVRDGLLGVFQLESPLPRSFDRATISLVEKAAAAIAQSIDNQRLVEALQTELEERRRTQAQLEIAKEAAEAASQAKSFFLANMSHELRTPLNSVIGYTELLLEGSYGELTDRQRDRLRSVERNGRHLLALINDVLDLSKIEAGQTQLELQAVPTTMILHECISMVEPMAIQKGLVLKQELPDRLPDVLGDMSRVRQVFTNLLNNAVKFTQNGYVQLSARTLMPGDEADFPYREIETPAVLFAVEDTGIGIAVTDHEVIFEAFRQLDGTSTREYEGTGLGLAIVKRLVELMRGQVWLESEPGKGSTFYVTLPAVPNAA